jgi:hypothetical protein
MQPAFQSQKEGKMSTSKASGSFMGPPTTLNRKNLELLDRENEANKDLFYAKIFSNEEGVKSKNNIYCS